MIEGSVFSNRLGLPGSGKSLGMTEEDLLPHLLADEEVYTNVWVNWNKPNIHYFNADEFEELAPTLRNCVLVMDEIGQVMEPRAWEQESGNIRRFFQLHRHHHVDIYGTTQDISLVAKSAWIVVDEWILCHKIDNNWLSTAIDWLLKRNSFKVAYQDMTYQELKKMANGWELATGEEEEGYSKAVGGEIRVKTYNIEKLKHKELDEFKIELYHYYCPKCAGRQGQIIPKEKKFEELIMEDKKMCPKHKETELIIRESGMYDSDYDIEIKEKDLVFVPMIDCPKGYRKIQYKGALSNKQTEELMKLQGRGA